MTGARSAALRRRAGTRVTAHASARPSYRRGAAAISSSSTSERGVACRRMSAVSRISTMNVLCPAPSRSAAPTRVKQQVDESDGRARRRHPRAALGEQHQHRDLAEVRALAAHCGAGETAAPAASRRRARTSLGPTTPPLATSRSTTGWRAPATLRRSESSSTGRTQPNRAAASASAASASSRPSAPAADWQGRNVAGREVAQLGRTVPARARAASPRRRGPRSRAP